MLTKTTIAFAGLMTCAQAFAQTDSIAPIDTAGGITNRNHNLQGVAVKAKVATRRMAGAENGMVIGQKELFRAACCNLGESFETNPSVDVSYTDAATGIKQIKLLGLSGTYVQMLSETLPDFRNSALPYSLGYVPGSWLKAIQVSKGCSSVKNGYESITGQMNIDYLKPEDEEQTNLNLYANTKTKVEANASHNWHITNRLSTILMGHAEKSFKEHDENHDNFYDKPKATQYNIMNRWAYVGSKYIFHGGLSALHEERNGGQMHRISDITPLYKIGIEGSRYNAYMKHAFVLNAEKGTNIAFMTSATMQELSSKFGNKSYYANDKNAYMSLMYETNLTPMHNISAGVSLNHDFISQHISNKRLIWKGDSVPLRFHETETTPGAYAQYTFNLHNKIIAMAGWRIDNSSRFGTFATPRFHVKFQPVPLFGLRLSAGKGYRTVNALAEYNNLMASGRTLKIGNLKQERAWNYGASMAFVIPVSSKVLKINAEYYYTTFGNQAVVDYDSKLTTISIENLNGKSYSHTLQIDATYPFFEGFSLTAAWRYNDVKTTYGGKLMERPLTSKYKGLVTAQYKTPLEKWQFDVTLQLNGSGRIPNHSLGNGTVAYNNRFHAFEQLSAQITREFRYFSIYLGGENLTNFKQKNPIVNAASPWSNTFDPTLVWGPVHGAMAYVGVRAKF